MISRFDIKWKYKEETKKYFVMNKTKTSIKKENYQLSKKFNNNPLI